MSRSVKIPSTPAPTFTCVINGTAYSYASGTTQTVPDEVAALIDNINRNKPKEDDPTITIVTSIGESSTDKDVPTAKAVYDALPEIPSIPVAEAVADATSETAVTTINAVIASLVAAGLMEEYIPPEPPEDGDGGDTPPEDGDGGDNSPEDGE